MHQQNSQSQSDSHEPQPQPQPQPQNFFSFSNPNPNPQQSQQQQYIDYQDIFQQARREQVLRTINQAQSHSECSEDERHEEVQAIMERRARREEKREEEERKNQMKRLRQQDALEFFRKVKMEVLVNFRDSIFDAKYALQNSETKICRLLSCCSSQILKMYQQLKAKQQSLRKRREFKELIVKIFTQSDLQLQGESRYQAIWGLAISLGIGFRKLAFIDISDMDLESFYNLKYVATKAKKKNISKQLDILRNRLQRRATQQQLKDKNFISIQQYSFNPRAHMKSQSTHPQQTQSSSTQTPTPKNSLTLSQKTQKLKKTFQKSFCQIYCPLENNWQLFNMQLLESQKIQDVKNTVLQDRAVIGFYSVRVMEFKEEYRWLEAERMLGRIQFRDQTEEFCDRLEMVLKRRLRLGCKNLYKAVIRESNIFKTLKMFTQFQKSLIQREDKKELDQALARFPKSVKQMRISDYFVTPSLVQKYMILKQDAKPIPNLQFHQQKVYSKKDLQKVSSRMGWIDNNRMVLQSQPPVKTTQNKTKSTTKLYKYSQTVPFQFKLTPSGDFILDEDYNSIYVPPSFTVPKGFVLVPYNVEYLCKRNQFRCARIVQGFDIAGSHIVPNNIGYLVQEQYRERIQKMYHEKQEKLKLKKQQRKIQGAMTLWRKLFKSIIITQQVHERS